MKFFHTATNQNLNLIQIPKTDFWHNKEGELFLATHGTCERISSKRAVFAILGRKTPPAIVRLVCCQSPRKSSSSDIGQFMKDLEK